MATTTQKAIVYITNGVNTRYVRFVGKHKKLHFMNSEKDASLMSEEKAKLFTQHYKLPELLSNYTMQIKPVTCT